REGRIPLAQSPTGADGVGEIVVGDLEVLVHRGGSVEIVGSIVDQDAVDLGSNGDLRLDVSRNLYVAREVGGVTPLIAGRRTKGTALITRWTIGSDGAAVDIDIDKRYILRKPEELVLVGGDVRRRVARQFKDRQ